LKTVGEGVMPGNVGVNASALVTTLAVRVILSKSCLLMWG
jgi:hypothetical protein